ncbi:DUF4229 domain-containing protein [Frigoribacterium sp. 2-23]|uniref:DUF4229 domain-containing protein n=1 Tax=Frigoribacterium sp. 2-23 TaxID=3415006 RepID=UPI003C6FD267
MKPWITYTIVRLGLFAVVLAVLLVIGIDPLWATLIAAIVGLCLSYIFFYRLRREVALSLATRRAAPEKRDDDSVAEDDALDER